MAAVPYVQIDGLNASAQTPAAGDYFPAWRTAPMVTVKFTWGQCVASMARDLTLAGAQVAYTDTHATGAATAQAALDALWVLNASTLATANAQFAASEKTARRGVAGGYTPLGDDGKIPLDFLPAALIGDVQYQGTWSAASNTPALLGSVGVKGQYYVVSEAGAHPLNGIASWQVGDWLVFDGYQWDRLAGSDGVHDINGKSTPSITLAAADIPYADAHGLGAVTVQTALDAVLAQEASDVAAARTRLASLESSRTADEADILALQSGVGTNAGELTSAITAISALSAMVASQATATALATTATGTLLARLTEDEAYMTRVLAPPIAGLGATYQALADRGAAGGYPSLDGSGKIPMSQIPSSLTGGLTYQGTWNAATNTPTLADGVGTNGFYYTVSTAGTTALDGTATWSSGDTVTFNAVDGKWERIPANTGAIQQLNGLTGAVVTLNAISVPALDPHGWGASNVQGQLNGIGAAAAASTAGLASAASALAAEVVTRTALSATVTANGIAAEQAANKGQANGYAGLGSDGKVPLAQLPAAVIGAVSFCGTWDASANVPPIVSGVGYQGNYYLVTVGGTTVINGLGLWTPGDWIVFNGTVWERLSGSDPSVRSVNGVAASSAGDIALPAASVPYLDTFALGVATVQQALDAGHTLSEHVARKGQANGYAGLNSAGTVPLSQLPASIQGAMEYQGTWDAAANTPTLASGAGAKGFYYQVSVAGSTALDGYSQWLAGDLVVFSGAAWEHISGAAATAAATAYTDTHAMGVGTVQQALDALWTLTEHAAHKGVALGYPSLDSTGKIPLAQLPTTISTAGNNTSYTDTYGVNGAQGAASTVQSAIDTLASCAVWASVCGVLPLAPTNVIATTAGSATLLKVGNSVTVSDGTTLATYTAANGDTVNTLVTAINGAPGLKIAAGLDQGGRLRLTAQRGVSIVVGGAVSAPATLASVLGLSFGTTASSSYASQASSVRVDDNYGVGATTVQAALDYILAQLSVLTHLTTTSAGGLTTTSS